MVSKSFNTEIQRIGGSYECSHLVSSIAEQLYSLIKDLDVCLLVAKLYIPMRCHDSTEECREFYMSQIWKERPGLQFARGPGSLGMLASRVHLWNPDYIAWRETEGLQWHKQTSHILWISNIRLHGHRISNKIANRHQVSKKILQYLTSPRGIRDKGQQWIIASAAWGVKNLDKEKITLNEKLDDLNHIPIGIINQFNWIH